MRHWVTAILLTQFIGLGVERGLGLAETAERMIAVGGENEALAFTVANQPTRRLAQRYRIGQARLESCARYLPHAVLDLFPHHARHFLAPLTGQQQHANQRRE